MIFILFKISKEKLKLNARLKSFDFRTRNILNFFLSFSFSRKILYTCTFKNSSKNVFKLLNYSFGGNSLPLTIRWTGYIVYFQSWPRRLNDNNCRPRFMYYHCYNTPVVVSKAKTKFKNYSLERFRRSDSRRLSWNFSSCHQTHVRQTIWNVSSATMQHNADRAARLCAPFLFHGRAFVFALETGEKKPPRPSSRKRDKTKCNPNTVEFHSIDHAS